MKQIIQNLLGSNATVGVFSKLCSKLSPKPTTTSLATAQNFVDSTADKCVSKYGRIKELFQQFDENGDGKISPIELQICLRTTGGELSSDEAVSVVESLDSDRDGLLGFDDFAKLMEANGEEEKRVDLIEAFGIYAMDGSGCISPKRLKRMLSRLDEMPIEQCKAIICVFELNGDGVLCFNEFRPWSPDELNITLEEHVQG